MEATMTELDSLIEKMTRTEKIAKASHFSSTNIEYCKQVMSAQLSGDIVLPHGLGLAQKDYQQLRKAVKDKSIINKELDWHSEDMCFIRERAEFCAEMFAMKEDERQELISLLSEYSNPDDPSSKEMAVIVATACLTKHHLWQSLGLKERPVLGKLIQYNFPELHAKNTQNMRWKRFFYKQLCEQGGDYICRAPSCEECKSYKECFA